MNKAFTLIELLVVVLIIGILSSIALPQYERAVMKSRYATLMSTTQSVAEAEEVYFLENGTYTDNFEALAIQPAGCTLSDNNSKCTFAWGTCSLNTANDDAVACVNNSSLQNGYARYFEHGKYGTWGTRCWAFTADSTDKYNKLCTQVGGTKTHDYGTASCPPYSSCAIYQL